MTLPDSTFDVLRAIDPDISRGCPPRRAGASGGEAAAGAASPCSADAPVIAGGRPERSKARGRALIRCQMISTSSLDQPRTVEELELLLYDALDDATMTAGQSASSSRASAPSSPGSAARRMYRLLRKSVVVLGLHGRRGREQTVGRLMRRPGVLRVVFDWRWGCPFQGLWISSVSVDDALMLTPTSPTYADGERGSRRAPCRPTRLCPLQVPPCGARHESAAERGRAFSPSATASPAAGADITRALAATSWRRGCRSRIRSSCSSC